MRVPDRFSYVYKELGPVSLVAIGVVVASTVVTSVFDRSHPADAEEVRLTETSAQVPSEGLQVLAIKEWGVSLTLPLAPGISKLSYVNQSANTSGLTSEGLKKLNPDCRASRNSLGSLIRMPAGSFLSEYAKNGADRLFVKTVGNYDYAYQWQDTGCVNSQAVLDTAMRERSVLYEAFSTLEPLK